MTGGNTAQGAGYPAPMSEFEPPPPADADREVSDNLDVPDPEAPSDSLTMHPPREDADREVPTGGDPLDDPLVQQENAGTSLDQPSDQSS